MRLERESSVLTWACKLENKREDERLPNKPKWLKAENSELAELKIVCLLKLKRMKNVKARTSENVGRK